MRIPQFIAIMYLALTCAAAPACAHKRVALVIGNDRYANLPANEQLQNAVNDARAVGGALMRIGFDVITGENLGRQAMIDKLGEAAQQLSAGDTVFFFFAGHGVAVDGANYILPSDVPDVEKGQATRLKGAAIAEDYIVGELLGAGARVAVMVLDACRDNLFGSGTRSIGGERGLAPRDPPSGVFTLYSAGRGQSALDRLSDDDHSPNSVFTRVFVQALTRPGIDLAALAIGVREEVARIAQTAGHQQRPAYYDETVGGQVYLAGPLVGNTEGGGSTSLQPAGQAEDELAWRFVKDTRDAEELRRFIAQFPLSSRRREADERLKALEQTNVALTLPARPPDVPKLTGGPCPGPVATSLQVGCDTPLTAAQERGLKTKDSFRECDNCPEMVVVPAGSFTMGSPKDEKDRWSDDEDPQHVVRIGKRFAIGRVHVTVDQFAKFVRETGHEASSRCWTFEGRWRERADRSWRNPGFMQEGSHPVVCVTWDDAKAYVDWMVKKTGKPYRLPSEAEWEYAARGRTSPGAYPRFWFGTDENDLCQNGNGADKKARDSIEGAKEWTTAPCDDGYAYTSPAGHYKPNAFGLYDMLGNAWQWTADCYHDSYNGAPADGSAWTAGDCDSRRVVRGGSWFINPRYLRAALRDRNSGAGVGIGLRLARTLTEPSPR